LNHKLYVKNLQDEIRTLCEKRRAVILAHNYQSPEVQDVADHVGDSLELAKRAVETDADVIVLAGVSFMAEVAAILNEDKAVLHPDPNAGCPLADYLSPETARSFREKYPGAPLVLYINSYAKVKAEADYIVTSASAEKLISKLDEDTVLFGPDKNLAHYVSHKLDRKVIPVPERGFCYVHEHLNSLYHVRRAISEHPDAKVFVHPEVPPECQEVADFIGSTSQMLRAIKSFRAKRFLLGTEEALSYRARVLYPNLDVQPINRCAVCADMKKINLLNIKESLEKLKPKVTIKKELRRKIKDTLELSFELIK